MASNSMSRSAAAELGLVVDSTQLGSGTSSSHKKSSHTHSESHTVGQGSTFESGNKHFSETQSIETRGSQRVGHLSIEEEARGPHGSTEGHSVSVSHQMGAGESYDSKAFHAAAAGKAVAGYDVSENSWSSSQVNGQTITHGHGSSTSYSSGESHSTSHSSEHSMGRANSEFGQGGVTDGASFSSHGLNAGIGHSASSHSASMGHSSGSGMSTRAGEGHSSSSGWMGQSGESNTHGSDHSHSMGHVQAALADHLSQAHGMSAAESHGVAHSVSSALSETLSHGEGHSSGHSVNFHHSGSTAVSLGAPIAAHEGSSVSMSTLQDVHDHGMPAKGVEALREHMGDEVASHSDLQVVDKFGHDVTHAIGEQGFPSKAVNDLQSEQGGSKTEALQQLGAEARSSRDAGHEQETAHEEHSQSAEMSMSM